MWGLKIEVSGQELLIDDCDIDIVRGCSSIFVDGKGYVATYRNGCRNRLHRLIINAESGQIVDHINRNKLDNRRSNLRITDRCGNARNSKFRSHNTSGFRGVYLCKQTQRWRAEIRVNGRGVKLGRFHSVVDAAIAYDKAAVRLHGAFAVTNFRIGSY